MANLLGSYWAKKFFIGGVVCLIAGALFLAGALGHADAQGVFDKPLPLGLGLGCIVAGVLLLRQWRTRKNAPEKSLTQGFLGGYWSRKYILGGIACLLASAFFVYDGATGGKLFYAQTPQTQLDQSEAVLAVILNFLGPFGFAALFFGLGVVGIRIGMLNKQRLKALEEKKAG